jgi:predicted DNA-binding transcriptional regulator AlpA
MSTKVVAGSGHNHLPDEFLSDTLLGKRMGCSATHVWHLAARGAIPQPYKVGRLARWNWPEVKAALKPTQTGPNESEVLRLNEASAEARERKVASAP